jgi:hypothetical protein
MRTRIFALALLTALLAMIVLGCAMGSKNSAQITATPTKTPRPLSTATPAPTATPVSEATPTDTPSPTDTAIAPTEAVPTEAPPTDTPPPTDTAIAPTEAVPTEAPPTDTPIPPTPVSPTHTPKPRPTHTPAPPTHTPKPTVDFRVVEQRLMPKSENEAQRHMILIRIVDGGGAPLQGIVVWDPNRPDREVVTGSKPEPYHAEYLFWDSEGYQLEVKGATSEKTKVLSTDVHKISTEDLIGAGYCPDANNCNPDELVQHFSWYITFQRTW